MWTLRDVQRAFAASVLGGDSGGLAGAVVEDGIAAADRLRIYRNTARTVLTGSLRLSYPCVDRLVGREFFDMAAARFIRAHPPRSGRLDDYGQAFADFLGDLPEAAGLAYLPDVARFEWALGRAAAADDAPALGVLALAGIAPDRHDEIRFEPHPSVGLLRLEFPADAIADAVLGGDEDAMAAVDLASGPVRLVVHRGPEGVRAERLDQEAYSLLERLFAGQPLGTALESAGPHAALHLADQFAQGRLSGFRLGSRDDDIP